MVFFTQVEELIGFPIPISISISGFVKALAKFEEGRTERVGRECGGKGGNLYYDIYPSISSLWLSFATPLLPLSFSLFCMPGFFSSWRQTGIGDGRREEISPFSSSLRSFPS